MRIFKTKWFARWADDQPLADAALILALEEIEQGLVDANLGGQVYKKRVARAGKGKSGGMRTLVAWRIEDRAIFIYGFAKNKRDNINPKELKALKLLAFELLQYDERQLRKLLKTGELQEVVNNE